MISEQIAVQVDPNCEFDLQKIETGPFVCLAAYARAYETRQYNDPGQDYLTISGTETSFCFALCDGVSQSFFGDFAAQYLGESLLSWLQFSLPSTLSKDEIIESLTDYLQGLTGPATKEISQYALPGNMSSMLRGILEQKRLYGSETMFVCGRVDLPCEEFIDGRIILAWMGDSRLRVWRHSTPIKLPDTFTTEQRWSSRRGAVGGMPNVLITTLWENGDLLNQIVSYSDGLAVLDAYSEMPSTSSLRSLINQTAQSHDSDDISFLRLSLRLPLEGDSSLPIIKLEEDEIAASAAELSAIDKAPRVPDIVQVEVVESTVQMSWHPTPFATHYEVVLLNGEQIRYKQSDCAWTSHILSPSTYKIRLRAWFDNKAGDWTAEQVATIPALDDTGANHASAWVRSCEDRNSSAAHTKRLSALLLWIIVLFWMILLLTLLTHQFSP